MTPVRKVSEVVLEGDREASLVAIRDRLAAAIDVAPPRDLAPLTRQLTQILREIAAQGAGEESIEDEVEAARAKRRARVSDSAAQ